MEKPARSNREVPLIAEEDLGLLRGKVARFTSRLGGPSATREPELVLVLAPGDSLEVALRVSREAVGRGRAVRIVGEGITVGAPATVPGLAITELGAYRVGMRGESTRFYSRMIRGWLDETFAGLVAGIEGSRVFFPSACTRGLGLVLDAIPPLVGIVTVHADAEVHYVGRATWAGGEVLRDLLGQPPGAEPTPWWRIATGARIAGGVVASVAEVVRARAKASRSLTALRKARSKRQPVDIWLALISDWPRFNHHLINSVALPALARNLRVGVLLQGSLAPGRPRESNLRERDGDDLWAGLGPLRDRLDSLVLDQAVLPERWRDVAVDVATSTGASLTAAWRILSRPATRQAGPWRLRLAGQRPMLEKLASIDVFRARSAYCATARAIARQRFEGSSVVGAGCGQPREATTTLSLERAGARTVEFFHGWSIEPWPGTEGAASVRVVWTATEARLGNALGFSYEACGVVPPDFRARSPGPRRARNVLLTTNYVHRDSIVEGQYSTEPFLHEAIAALELLRADSPELELRWRPHPADDPAVVRRVLATAPWLTLSTSADLKADVDWADLVVTSLSSVFIETLFADVPVVLHVTPDFDGAAALDFVDASRQFFYRRDGARKVGSILAALAEGDDALKPDRAALRACFDGDPRRLDAVSVCLGEARPPAATTNGASRGHPRPPA